ncbi:MAG TPA: hypothetical protein VGO31_08290 [Microbacteriaceae bacterium]|jgi:hypothetical protein|nr:hypothetical protein [Microbacteriaceae bacterium]
MTGGIVVVVILVVLLVPAGMVGARLGRRLGTPPSATPPKIEGRTWVLLAATFVVGVIAAGCLLWAVEHHHAALGFLVLVGTGLVFHIGLLALRYRRHRRRASK